MMTTFPSNRFLCGALSVCWECAFSTILVTSDPAAAPPTTLRAPRRLIIVRDPDGYFIELIAPDQSPEAPEPGNVVGATFRYTAVDAAENDPEAAYRANRDGPGRLARACARADVPLIHISTDYVFDGSKGVPYVETDTTVPTGVYGASKLAGEQAALTAAARVVILRTSWLYGPTGNNFVRTMLRLGATRDRLQVVGDQRGCPTTSSDLAGAILAIATRLQGGWRRNRLQEIVNLRSVFLRDHFRSVRRHFPGWLADIADKGG